MAKKPPASGPSRTGAGEEGAASTRNASSRRKVGGTRASKAPAVVQLTDEHEGRLWALVNVRITPEFAAVPEDEWDSYAGFVHLGSREATEQALRSRDCYDVTSAERHRDWMTELDRLTAVDCRTRAERRFVLVRLRSFQGAER